MEIPEDSLQGAAEWLEAELLVERERMEKQHRRLVEQFKLIVLKSSQPGKAANGLVACLPDIRGDEANIKDMSLDTMPTEQENYADIDNQASGFQSEASQPRLRQQTSRILPGSHGPIWGSSIEDIVTGSMFEIIFGLLIAVNAMIMALEIQYEGTITAYKIGINNAPPPNETWEVVFKYMEWLFGCIFTLEVLIKITVLRRRFFRETVWNVFDLIIVTAWLFNQALTTFTIPLDPTLLRVARLAKLARLLRALRLLVMVHPLIVMVKAISASVSILVWSLFVLTMLISVMAIVVAVVLEPWMRSDANPLKERTELFDSWGSYIKAFSTMSEITVGNFGPPLRELQNNVAEYWGVLILLYKLTIGFAVVQVVTSVFIQQTFKVAEVDAELMIKEKTRAAKTYANQLSKLFEYLDESGDGMISREEFDTALEDDRVAKWFGALDVDAMDVKELFDMLAGDDGHIDRGEFMTGIKVLAGKAKATSMIMLFDSLAKKMDRLFEKVDEVGEAASVSWIRQTSGSRNASKMRVESKRSNRSPPPIDFDHEVSNL